MVAVFLAEVFGLWVAAGLKYFYHLDVEPLDLRLNILVFTTVVAWWTDYMSKS